MATLIGINGNVLTPEVLAEGGVYYSPDAAHSNYILVHCWDLNRLHAEELKANKAILLTGLGDHCICKYEPSDLTPLRNLPFVISANVFHPDHVVEASLKAKVDYANRSLPRDDAGVSKVPVQDKSGLQEQPEGTASEGSVLKVTITLHPNPTLPSPKLLFEPTSESRAYVDGVINRIVEATGIDPASMVSDGRVHISTYLPPKDLTIVAQIEEVQGIEEEHQPEPRSSICRTDMRVNPPEGDLSKICTPQIMSAEGVVIGVTDSGFDNWETESQWKENKHPVFPNRPAEVVNLWKINDKLSDRNGHGTHIAGCIIGNGKSDKFGDIQGTAPQAKLVFQSVNDPSRPTGIRYPSSPDEMQQALEKFGRQHFIQIHSLSFGLPATYDESKYFIQRGYTPATQMIDSIVWNNQENLILVAAGNDGGRKVDPNLPSQGQLGAFEIAKNVLTIGAVHSSRKLALSPPNDDTRIYLYYSPDGKLQGSPLDVAYYSSRGPTQPPDGATGDISKSRNKPDLVAPGTAVYSARSRAIELAAWKHPDYDFYGVTPEGERNNFIFHSGTSTATPLVAGCAAVVLKLLKTTGTSNPAAALIKALFINNAIDLYEARNLSPEQTYTPFPLSSLIGPAPDPFQGWGLVNIEATIRNIIDKENGGILNDKGPLANPKVEDESNDSETSTFNIQSKKDPNDDSKDLLATLTATLVWTDWPGPCLYNYLSLTARAKDGKEWTDKVNSKAQADNVRKVVARDLVAGTYDLEVRCVSSKADSKYLPVTYSLAWYVSYGPPSKKS